ELVVEAFDGYWRKTPSIKRIVFRSLPDETTRAAALKSGEVDLAMLLTGPVAQDIRRTPGMRLAAPLLGIFWLDFPDQWDPRSPWAGRGGVAPPSVVFFFVPFLVWGGPAPPGGGRGGAPAPQPSDRPPGAQRSRNS